MKKFRKFRAGISNTIISISEWKQKLFQKSNFSVKFYEKSFNIVFLSLKGKEHKRKVCKCNKSFFLSKETLEAIRLKS